MGDQPHDPAQIDAMWRAALAHHAAGRVRDAAMLYKQIVAAVPDHAPALHHLGVIAHGAGHHADAARILGRVTELQPAWADPHVNLGLVLHTMARHASAIESYGRAIALSPQLATAHNNLGSALQATGRLDDAIASYQRAVDIDPSYAGAHGNLGNALREARRAEEAVAAHRRAVGLQPNSARAHHNLSLSLGDAGQLLESTTERQRALELDPSLADPSPFAAAVTDAQSLAAAGRAADAAAAYRRAADHRPDRADVWHNLSVVLIDAGDPDAAITAAERALALEPNDPATLNNLAGALKAVGRVADAVDCYRRAVALGGPMAPRIAASLAYAVTFDPAATAADVLAAARACDVAADDEARPSGPSLNGRMRVGYVSPDFRDHVVGRNLLPLVRAHDRSVVEVFCYGSVARPDAITAAFQSASDHWRDVSKLDDNAAADLIRADRIDVLVDLTLHMAGNRLGVFARRPAPVQATFGGYPGTTGLSCIDHRLTDPYLDPAGADGDYAERSVRLPHSFWCYDPIAMEVANEPDPGPPPAIANGFVTFGCLNNFCKVNPEVLAAWEQVLAGVPGSRLTMFTPPGQARDRVRAVLGDRVSFVPFMPRVDYLQVYRGIDLCLDTFPYNGHTTSLDGLWMGVPTVTFIGRTVVGRAGWSQLSNLGLTELAATDQAGFISAAIGLARDLPRLATLRAGLRERMQRSPVTDSASFARGVETAFRLIWDVEPLSR